MSEWVLEVSEVNEYVRQLLQNEPALRKVRLRGEISNFKRHSSGHWYFTLKDERCRIAAVMFRQNAMRMSIRPMDGMSVIVSGQVGLYSEGGSYQITCDSMRPDGIGTLYQQFEALKNRLAAEGLFDEEHKRRLPYRPKKIAVVTSETGAVLHDICMVSRARDPGVPLVLVPVQVQGAGAAESIAQGIRRAAKIPEVEVVIVGRGGGSMEDLWAFNEEIVARAIYDCPIPVISAVGHETDFTIADFVADRRAATPSNAAEMAVPDLREILAGLDGMRQHLQTALSQHIAGLDWMSDATKAKAQEKLAAFTVKIGYPDKWKDYTTLEIDPAKSYWENIVNANIWYTEDNIADLGKPVDKEEWGMTPQTVNAYYNPTTNEICFPAAILQPPFYNPDADDAVNYGAIGVVIGHEMTHGFDDQGRQFDKDGNMNNWWTDEDAAAFKAKTDILVKQFDAIEVLPAKDGQPALHANGSLSLGENIADQGGLRVAWTAYHNSLEGKEKPAPIDGFTPEQRFYLGYATLWAQNIRDEEAARLTKLDVHSLGKWRVNATLRNLQTFYDAFGITDGAMFLPEEERVIIW